MRVSALTPAGNEGAYRWPAILAASKSHDKDLSDMNRFQAIDWMHRWAAQHRNIAEHIVIPMEVMGISRELGSILSDQVDGFTETERSQRYCEVERKDAFLYDHPINKVAMDGYKRLRGMGAEKEDARYLLPKNVTTEMVVTTNRVTWINICRDLKRSKARGASELLALIMSELNRVDGDYDFDRVDWDKTPYEYKVKDDWSGGLLNEPIVRELKSDGIPTGIYEMAYSMSEAAFYQFKRHRKVVSLRRSQPIRGEYFYPPRIYEKEMQLKAYKEVLEEHKAMLEAPALNASLLNFGVIIGKPAWDNAIHFRDDSHAQFEIRSVVQKIEELRKEL